MPHQKENFIKAQWNFFSKLPFIKKVVYVITLVGISGLVFVGLLFFLVWSELLGPVPNRRELEAIKNPVASEVYSADSVLLGKYFYQDRSHTPYREIPPIVIDALLATEDIRFFDHQGIDYRSLARVFVRSIILRQASAGGGSTLTQQLVKNLFPRKSYWVLSTPINKFKEMMVARKLESIYTKQEILELYLNTVPFGENAFGIASAASRFFSKSLSKLSTQEAAILIGMLKATYTYNPRLFPSKSKQRRNVVLEQMAKYGYVEPGHLDSLKATALTVAYRKPTHHEGLAPYFREGIKSELMSWCQNHVNEQGEPLNLFTDGLKIYTTLDSRMQYHAEKAMQEHMKTLQHEFDRQITPDFWKDKQDWIQEQAKQSIHYKKFMREGLTEKEIWDRMGEPTQMKIFSWEGEKEIRISPLDSIRHFLSFLHAGMLAMAPTDGKILTWVGGINHQYFQYDHVRESTKRQVGSTFKPIVYAAALEQGIEPCSYISAKMTQYTNMEDWQPKNAENNYDRKYSMAGALAHSVNTASVRLAEETGLSQVIGLASEMGINSDIPEVPSLALGTASISVMEMVKAYCVFANGGRSVRPYYLTAITDAQGKPLEVFQPKGIGPQVMTSDNAQVMLALLEGVVDHGTASGLRTRYGITGDLAGKTGTTQNNTDGWFLGVMPQVIVGTWVGGDNPAIRFQSTALGQGAHMALPIFAGWYRNISKDNKLRELTEEHFQALSKKNQKRLDCKEDKSDQNLLEKIFKKEEGVEKRGFGQKKEKKKGWLDRLFSK